MNAENFINNFGHLANAPEGPLRIRDLILQLAFSGDLTIRSLEDVHASVIFDTNQQTKANWIAKGKIRQQSLLNSLTDAEHPWNLPATWLWCRLGEVTTYGASDKAKFIDTKPDTWVLELEDIEKDTSRLIAKIRAKDRRFQSSKNRFSQGDVLYGKLRPYLDKVVLADEDGVCTTEIIPITAYSGILPEYLRWFLKSPFFKAYASGSTHGMNLPRMGTEAGRNAVFPLAPLAEQRRIVSKIDELMALCDQLEANLQEREQRFPVLSRACHAEFATAPYSINLSRIFDEVGRVNPSDLRNTILTLAMRGKLVPQNPREESASQLLERIAEKRGKLLTNGYPNPDEAKSQLRKQREQRLPGDLRGLPVGWKWATLMQASLLIVDCHNKTAPYVSTGIPLIRTTNIRKGRLNLQDPRYVSDSTYERWSARCKPEPGDILITREAPMGEACIIPLGMKICMGQRMMLIRLVPDTVDANFLLYSIMDPELMNRVKDKPIGATVQHLRVGGVETLLVPVPPLGEQRRIVAKLDELISLVDQLEACQRECDQIAGDYAESYIASFTGIAQLAKPEKMKAPKSELVSIVSLSKKKSNAENLLVKLLKQNNGTLPAKSLWQQSGLAIDAFYQQLKTAISQGWIAPPVEAEMKILEEP